MTTVTYLASAVVNFVLPHILELGERITNTDGYFLLFLIMTGIALLSPLATKRIKDPVND